MAGMTKQSKSNMQEVNDLEALIDEFKSDILDDEEENIPPRIYKLLDEWHDKAVELHKNLDKEVEDLEDARSALLNEKEALENRVQELEDERR